MGVPQACAWLQCPAAPLTWLGCSQRMFSGFRSLWAMPAGRTRAGVWGARLGAPRARGWQEGGGTQRSRPPPTFVVQEIQGAGHVLHHHARLQLVEVPALVDVAQDGAWPREDTGDGRVTVRPGHSAAPAPPGTEAPAQPPRAKVFNLSCCVARKLRLHEPSLPRMTL